MTESPLAITSDFLLKDVSHNFRVLAGPGAGKTYWLVRHILNVLKTRHDLSASQRIACISYTNIAVEEINKALGSPVSKVEASTIHGFLYRNVVKPYLHLLVDEHQNALVDFARVDGHDEHMPSYELMQQWVSEVGQVYLLYDKVRAKQAAKEKALRLYFRDLRWSLDETSGRWSLVTMHFHPDVLLSKSSRDQLPNYKRLYWRRGIIDHEDVLYFAHEILHRWPELRQFLSARYPYLFIDEFQDTHPVQTHVVRWLAAAGSYVGVVGDGEQSIYGFQGANPEHFVNVRGLPNRVDYSIAGNRRSTDSIISILNYVRADGLVQTGLRGVSGDPVQVIVGDAVKALSHVRARLPDGASLVTLARNNNEVVRLRSDGKAQVVNPWNEFDSIDHNRCRFVEPIVKACTLANERRFGEAVRILRRGISSRDGRVREPLRFDETLSNTAQQGLAVGILEGLCADWDGIQRLSLLDVYDMLGRKLRDLAPRLVLTATRSGTSFHTFAKSIAFRSLTDSVLSSEETREVRTIHKAKAAEFENVLVVLSSRNELQYVLNPELKRSAEKQEEKRILYVGLSRSRDRLFLSVPDVQEADHQAAARLGLRVERLE